MDIKKLIAYNSHYLQKVKTRITGFDYLLFDGLDLTNKRTVIVIQGDETTGRTLLGLQMLYGLGQSLFKAMPQSHKLENGPFLRYASNYHSADYIEDLLLDTTISSFINLMTEKYVSESSWAQLSDGFSSEFFDKETICCQNLCSDFYERLPLTDILSRTDELICEEAIYYSNRTNSLHFRSDYSPKTDDIIEPLEGYVKTDADNILFTRKHDKISEYVYKDSSYTINEQVQQLGSTLSFPFVGVDVEKFDESCCDIGQAEVTAMDIALCKSKMDTDDEWNSFLMKIQAFRNLNEDPRHRVLILIVPETVSIPDCLTDIHIKMRSRLELEGYLISRLSIKKSRMQSCALGWHQYKRRDYGIEVYPSLHNYFAQRRYMQRAMVYTHSDVITDTYQQYLDRNRFMGKKHVVFQNFEKDKQKMKEDYLRELYPQYNTGEDFMDILGKIFLTDEQYNREHQLSSKNPNDVKDLIYGYRGGVTAIIGASNTYKRFFTFGSAFSSSVSQEHTLFLLLNKEDTMIRRRLACPARINKGENCDQCSKCYSYMHFMQISMGNITPDELIFFFQKQLEVSFRDGKKVTRVIMDDLEIIDYCFPFLHRSQLFLSALAAVCRERNISLYILCDKQGLLVKELRAVADNTICLGRDQKGRLLIYIDKFAGYNNTPCKIYSGKINTVKELFRCYHKMDDKEHLNPYFSFNPRSIEDHFVITMDEFWSINNDKN